MKLKNLSKEDFDNSEPLKPFNPKPVHNKLIKHKKTHPLKVMTISDCANCIKGCNAWIHYNSYGAFLYCSECEETNFKKCKCNCHEKEVECSDYKDLIPCDWCKKPVERQSLRCFPPRVKICADCRGYALKELAELKSRSNIR